MRNKDYPLKSALELTCINPSFDFTQPAKPLLCLILVKLKLFCMKKSIAMLLTAFSSFPLIADAHPGHGEDGGYTIIHYFTQPVHAVLSLSVVALMAYIVVSIYKNSRKQKA